MKIVTSVCEYNPFHNGHLYHLNYIKEHFSPDYIILVMSGNFTQRGEIAITDKYTRAVHAIKAGADAVIELPAVFATQTAEIFAKGSTKLINAIPGDKSICFGCETDNKNNFLNLASILVNEPCELKQEIQSLLKTGESFIRAREKSITKLCPEIDTNILSKPNNILGLEYTKAIISGGFNVDILPILRQGAGYSDTTISDIPSSMAIRNSIKNNHKDECNNSVPSFVYNDLPDVLPDFEREIMFSILKAEKNTIKNTLDCGEGLENLIKKVIPLSNTPEDIINNVSNKRYTSSRIRRILLSTTLEIYKSFIYECLKSPMYLKILSSKGDRNVLKFLSDSTFPVITNGKDEKKLLGVALKAFSLDKQINEYYKRATGKNYDDTVRII